MKSLVPILVVATITAAAFAPLSCGVSGAGGSGGPGPATCEDLLATVGTCSVCVSGRCCAELAECADVPGCLACVTGSASDGSVCGDSATKAAIDAVRVCTSEQCGIECGSPSPACDAPATPPSNGGCFAISADAGAPCNPVTNEGCDGATGEACDVDGVGGFTCYPPPSAAPLCEPCGADAHCAGGLTCLGTCAKYCCDDGDCGAGTCDRQLLLHPTIGVCVEKP